MNDSAHQLKDALHTSMRVDGFTPKKGSSTMPPHSSSNDSGGVKLPTVTIDFRVPLWQLAAAACFFVTGLIGMYYQLAQLSADVSELKATVKTANVTTIQFATEQALIKFRLEKLERDSSIRNDRK